MKLATERFTHLRHFRCLQLGYKYNLFGFSICSPNSVVTPGVLTVSVKGRCLVEVLHRGVQLICCYLHYTFMPLEILEVYFDCASSQNLGGRGGRLSGLRSRWGAVRIFGHGGHFSWQAHGKPRFLVVQSLTCRDRRKGSERFCREMQFSWQHFGYGGEIGRALIS